MLLCLLRKSVLCFLSRMQVRCRSRVHGLMNVKHGIPCASPLVFVMGALVPLRPEKLSPAWPQFRIARRATADASLATRMISACWKATCASMVGALVSKVVAMARVNEIPQFGMSRTRKRPSLKRYGCDAGNIYIRHAGASLASYHAGLSMAAMFRNTFFGYFGVILFGGFPSSHEQH